MDAQAARPVPHAAATVPAEVIQTDHLTKRYGSVSALTDLTLAVRPGEIFGFLGPNGAGKSTMIRTLAGLPAPDRRRRAPFWAWTSHGTAWRFGGARATSPAGSPCTGH